MFESQSVFLNLDQGETSRPFSSSPVIVMANAPFGLCLLVMNASTSSMKASGPMPFSRIVQMLQAGPAPAHSASFRWQLESGAQTFPPLRHRAQVLASATASSQFVH